MRVFSFPSTPAARDVSSGCGLRLQLELNVFSSAEFVLNPDLPSIRSSHGPKRTLAAGVHSWWVAIDDMDLVKMIERLQAAHFVRTDDGIGMTAAGAEEVM